MPATRPVQFTTGAREYQVRSIKGWTVHINTSLLTDHPATLDKAMELLTGQLKQITQVVPAEVVTHLQKIPLWINPEYPKIPPRAEYHPNADWLRANGRDPQMARGVEFTNVRIFQRECVRMPCLVLHELAHGYHDQVLGFDEPNIHAAYQRAVENKSYDRVERWNGDPSRPNTFERAYAMTNDREYFAETTEAFFGRNDFFPFDAKELKQHDPEMFKLLARVWKVPDDKLPGK
jgi:hypothetical protein